MEEPARSIATVNPFESVYRNQVGYVIHSLRRLGVMERDLEDLAHDVLIIVARKFHEYDESRPIRPWLFGITFRVALDYRRSARQRNGQVVVPGEMTDQSPAADAELELKEMQRWVLEALDTLSIEQRAVFVLHDIDGTPVPEIATVLHIPLNTAYSRLRLARNQFGAAIRELKGGDG
jgi:RNA polymerase sigma-70 factor (ECF subfamily)